MSRLRLIRCGAGARELTQTSASESTDQTGWSFAVKSACLTCTYTEEKETEIYYTVRHIFKRLKSWESTAKHARAQPIYYLRYTILNT